MKGGIQWGTRATPRGGGCQSRRFATRNGPMRYGLLKGVPFDDINIPGGQTRLPRPEVKVPTQAQPPTRPFALEQGEEGSESSKSRSVEKGRVFPGPVESFDRNPILGYCRVIPRNPCP